MQLVTNPRWGKNILDFSITTNDSLIIKTQVIKKKKKTQVVPGISDHNAMFVEGNIKATINKQKQRMVPLYRKADWDGLKEHVSKYVVSVMHSTNCDLSINDSRSSFQEELTSGIKRFIPHRFQRQEVACHMCPPY